MVRTKLAKSGLWHKPLFFLPLIVGLMLMLGALLHYGMNVPSEDQWEMVPLFQKADHHTLGFSDLWHQHNEHRIFFPLLILLGSAYATNWNTVAETLIGFILAGFSATIIFLILKEGTRYSWTGILAGLVMAAWFFSPVQWENWLWGWQIEWFMCVLAAVITTYSLLKFLDAKSNRTRKLLFISAALSAFIATFSLASGILVWAMGVFMLVVGKQSKKSISVWIAAALLTTAVYFYHYAQTPTPSGPATTVFIHNPLKFIEFFVLFIGGVVGSVSSNMQAAYIVGSLLLVASLPLLYMVWIRRTSIRAYLPWLSLMLFALLCASSAAFGRLGYGIKFALSSRYTAFSLLYIIGLIGLGFTLILCTQNLSINAKRIYIWSIVLICLPLLISSYVIGVRGLNQQSKYLKIIKTCTHEAVPSDECLLATYPNAQIARSRLSYLKSRHWAGY